MPANGRNRCPRPGSHRGDHVRELILAARSQPANDLVFVTPTQVLADEP